MCIVPPLVQIQQPGRSLTVCSTSGASHAVAQYAERNADDLAAGLYRHIQIILYIIWLYDHTLVSNLFDQISPHSDDPIRWHTPCLAAPVRVRRMIRGPRGPKSRAPPQPTQLISPHDKGLTTIPQCTRATHVQHTTPLYCTRTLHTFSYTVSTNEGPGVAEPCRRALCGG